MEYVSSADFLILAEALAINETLEHIQFGKFEINNSDMEILVQGLSYN